MGPAGGNDNRKEGKGEQRHAGDLLAGPGALLPPALEATELRTTVQSGEPSVVKVDRSLVVGFQLVHDVSHARAAVARTAPWLLRIGALLLL